MIWKLGTVWGVLPYIQTQAGKQWAYARGPWLTIPELKWEHTPLLEHERHHVKQWYAGVAALALAAIGARYATEGAAPAVYWAAIATLTAAYLAIWHSPWMRYRCEVAAYGVSLREIKHQGGNVSSAAQRYSRALAADGSPYQFDATAQRAHRDILRSLSNPRLF